MADSHPTPPNNIPPDHQQINSEPASQNIGSDDVAAIDAVESDGTDDTHGEAAIADESDPSLVTKPKRSLAKIAGIVAVAVERGRGELAGY